MVRVGSNPTGGAKHTEKTMETVDKELEFYRKVFSHLLPNYLPDTYFICGEGGSKDANGLPDRISICPAYGSDVVVLYEKVERK